MATKYKDSGIPWIGLIPEDWKVCKFKNVTTLYNGNSLNDLQKEHYSRSFAEECYPYIATKDIQLDIESVNYDNGIKVPKENCPFLIAPKHSTLLCIEGGSAGKKVGYVNQDVCFVNKLCCFHSKQNNRFVYYYVLSRAFAEPFSQNIQGLIGGVSVSAIKNFPLLLPSPITQQRIADFLDRKCAEIDELAALQETMIAELKRYKQSVITEAVTKGLDPNVAMKDSGVEWIGEIPEGWEVKRLKFVANRRNEKADDTTLKYIGLEHIVGFSKEMVETENVYDNEGANMCYDRDVIFGKLRPYLGKAKVIEDTCCCSSEFLVLCNVHCPDYLRYLMLSGWFIEIVNASTYGTKMPRANADFIMNMLIPVPRATEQRAIADYLDRKCAEIDELIAIKQQKIEALKEYKKSVIFEYVTGKKEVL